MQHRAPAVPLTCAKLHACTQSSRCHTNRKVQSCDTMLVFKGQRGPGQHAMSARHLSTHQQLVLRHLRQRLGLALPHLLHNVLHGPT